MNRWVVAGTCALTASGAAIAAGPTAAEQAAALLRECLAIDHGSGVQAAVVIDGQVVWSGVAGRADLEWDIPMASDVRMRIGSVSKPLAAAAVAALAADGAVDLDAPIGDVILELSADKAVITLRQLATHTSGIRHYDFSNYLEANNVFVRQDLFEALGPLLAEPLLHAPGESVTYTSIGYNLIGAVVERASGQAFGDVFTERVARPLGLKNTVMDAPLDVVARRSGFYTVFPDGSLRNTVWRDSSDGYPSLGILSTAEDLARFADSAFDAERNPDGYALNTSSATILSGERIDRTFAWEIGRSERGDVEWYGHNGETNGGMAVVRHFPRLGMSVAGVANYNVYPGVEPVFYEAIATDLPALFVSALKKEQRE